MIIRSTRLFLNGIWCVGLCSAAMACGRSSRTALAEQEAVLRSVQVDPVLDCATLIERVRAEWGGFMVEAPGEGARPQMFYRPAELRACLEADTALTMEEFQEQAKVYRSSEEYVLNIPRGMTLSGTTTDDAAFLAYLDQGLRADTYELVEGDTVRCAFAHLEASGAMASGRTVVLGFDRSQDGSGRALVLKDGHGFFGEDLRFAFSQDAFAAYHRLVHTSSSTTSPGRP